MYKDSTKLEDVPNKANLWLQILLQLNIYMSSAWVGIYGFHILYYVHILLSALWNIHGLFVILAYITTLTTEWYRLYVGYSVNLRARTADLSTFLILSILIQLPLLLFLLLSAAAQSLLIMISIGSIFVCMAVEMVISSWTWRQFCNYQNALYQLRHQMQLQQKSFKFRLTAY